MVPKLGIKQQLTLDHLCATTERILAAIKCKKRWRWVKGHQVKYTGKKWKVEIDINNFCDGNAEEDRGL